MARGVIVGRMRGPLREGRVRLQTPSRPLALRRILRPVSSIEGNRSKNIGLTNSGMKDCNRTCRAGTLRRRLTRGQIAGDHHTSRLRYNAIHVIGAPNDSAKEGLSAIILAIMPDTSPSSRPEQEARAAARTAARPKAAAAASLALATAGVSLSKITMKGRRAPRHVAREWAAKAQSGVSNAAFTEAQNKAYIAGHLADAQSRLARLNARTASAKKQAAGRAKADAKRLRSIASACRAVVAARVLRLTPKLLASIAALSEIARRCRASVPAKDIPALSKIAAILQVSHPVQIASGEMWARIRRVRASWSAK